MTDNSAVATGDDAPLCPGPQSEPRSPKHRLPAGACDSHMHICGPGRDFPYDAQRIYTPPDALVVDYRKVMDCLGIDRVVLVQPSIYGTDNRVMLNAMAELSAAGIQNRGVAVVDFAVTDEALAQMHQAGVRGLRFNLVDVADPSQGLPLAQIRRLAERIGRFGWHVEFLAHVDDYPQLAEMFGDFPTDIVFGHSGYVRIANGPQARGFQAMLTLAAAAKCWIKMTGPYRIAAGGLPFKQAGDYARACVAAAPHQVIWGTDWPHVKIAEPMPHDGDMCDCFYDWVPEPKHRQQILLDNPTRLYGF